MERGIAYSRAVLLIESVQLIDISSCIVLVILCIAGIYPDDGVGDTLNQS